MQLYIVDGIYLNIRIIVDCYCISQTCLICPDRVTGETKAFTSQCKLHKGHDGIRNHGANRIVWIECLFSNFLLNLALLF